MYATKQQEEVVYDDMEEDEEEQFKRDEFRSLLGGFQRYIVQPFLVGLSGAIGLSVGYAIFDKLSVFLRGTSRRIGA